jgi:hypothetical protein
VVVHRLIMIDDGLHTQPLTTLAYWHQLTLQHGYSTLKIDPPELAIGILLTIQYVVRYTK